MWYIRLLLAVGAIVLCYTAQASSQQPSLEAVEATGLTEYELTGDTLWDTYTQALLGQLVQQLLDFEDQPVSIYNSVLPQETILEWEAEFGDDPRFWQLCYVNANAFDLSYTGFPAKLKDYEYSGPRPLHYLERASALYVADKTAIALLVKEQISYLHDQWRSYTTGEIDAVTLDGFPVGANGPETDAWFEARELELLDSLVRNCPDESDSYYRRAEYWFQLGEWESALADLEAGNLASHNRVPIPFPFSFILDAARAGTPVGNELAAGAVALDLMRESYGGNVIRVKDNLRNQFVRLNLGAPVNELVPWIAYLSRYASAENGKELRWRAGAAFLGEIAEYFLVENGELLTRDQRAAALQLAERAERIESYLAYESYLEWEQSDSFISKTERLFKSYGLAFESKKIVEIDADDPLMLELGIAMWKLYYEHYWDVLQREQSILYPELVERCSHLPRFNPVEIKWEPREIAEPINEQP